MWERGGLWVGPLCQKSGWGWGRGRGKGTRDWRGGWFFFFSRRSWGRCGTGPGPLKLRFNEVPPTSRGLLRGARTPLGTSFPDAHQRGSGAASGGPGAPEWTRRVPTDAQGEGGAEAPRDRRGGPRAGRTARRGGARGRCQGRGRLTGGRREYTAPLSTPDSVTRAAPHPARGAGRSRCTGDGPSSAGGGVSLSAFPFWSPADPGGRPRYGGTVEPHPLAPPRVGPSETKSLRLLHPLSMGDSRPRLSTPAHCYTRHSKGVGWHPLLGRERRPRLRHVRGRGRLTRLSTPDGPQPTPVLFVKVFQGPSVGPTEGCKMS